MPTSNSEPRPFVQAGDDLNDFLRSFWQRQIDSAEQETPDHRHPALPLARIKKVMKSDPEVKQMIAADAPILFCKACEIFIAEITARAFIQADASKRRTLSRQDIVRALARSDQFDFLIDIVPREEPLGGGSGGTSGATQQAGEKRKRDGVDDGKNTRQRADESQVHGADVGMADATGGASPQDGLMMLDQLQSLLHTPGGNVAGGPHGSPS